MKIAAIKSLVESFDIDQLKEAESLLLEEKPLPIEVIGDDEGEKLTHILAAMEIITNMKLQQLDFKTALRNYTQRVRTSIS